MTYIPWRTFYKLLQRAFCFALEFPGALPLRREGGNQDATRLFVNAIERSTCAWSASKSNSTAMKVDFPLLQIVSCVSLIRILNIQETKGICAQEVEEGIENAKEQVMRAGCAVVEIVDLFVNCLLYF